MGSLELLVYAYPDEESANKALKRLKDRKKEGIIDVVNAAVIVKDEKGKIHTRETADPGAKEGALFGAIVGGLVGLIGGPAGVVLGAAAGAGTGGFAAKKIDMGIPDSELQELGSALDEGSSAIIAVIKPAEADKLRAEMEHEADLVLEQAIKEEIAAQLTENDDNES